MATKAKTSKSSTSTRKRSTAQNKRVKSQNKSGLIFKKYDNRSNGLLDLVAER